MDATQVREAREANGWTQAMLAERAGLSQSTVSRVERGEIQPPEALVRFLRTFGSRRDPKATVALTPPRAWRPLSEHEAKQLVQTRRWQRPASSGDVLITRTVRDGLVLLAVDVAGYGPDQVPKVTFVEGWLRGWTAALSVVPTIESLAEQLTAELENASLEAAWFAAILVNDKASPHRVAYQGVASRFSPPLLLVGAPPSTLPSVGTGEQPIRHRLQAPWRIAVASDGLLKRLGRGDEVRGKTALQEWLSSATRDRPLEEQLSTDLPLADDELYGDVTWQRWDGTQSIDVHADEERHRLKRTLRQNLPLEPKDKDRFALCVGEALKNAMEHGYGPGGGRVNAMWRDEGDKVRVEIEDGGGGVPPFVEGGGFKIMRAFADTVDVRRLYPQGVIVSLAKMKGDGHDER